MLYSTIDELFTNAIAGIRNSAYVSRLLSSFNITKIMDVARVTSQSSDFSGISDIFSCDQSKLIAHDCNCSADLLCETLWQLFHN